MCREETNLTRASAVIEDVVNSATHCATPVCLVRGASSNERVRGRVARQSNAQLAKLVRDEEAHDGG